MEKDIEKIPKNQDTDIIIRIDDFGGKKGLTIREFVKSERYTGFTKSGTRIPSEYFQSFKKAINSNNEKDLEAEISQEIQATTKVDDSAQTHFKSGGTKAKKDLNKQPDEEMFM